MFVETKDYKLVSDYTNLSFSDVAELDCYTFKVLLRDAFIDTMSNSEKGREFLEDAWNIRQVEPDKESLRKHFSKGGK